MGTKKARTGKPATLGDMLRRLIVRTASQLHPGQSQPSECPPGEHAGRLCRGTPDAGLGDEPIPNRRAALIQANLIKRDAAEHHVLVVRLDQREVQLIATQAGLFLLSDVLARISLGVGGTWPAHTGVPRDSPPGLATAVHNGAICAREW